MRLSHGNITSIICPLVFDPSSSLVPAWAGGGGLFHWRRPPREFSHVIKDDRLDRICERDSGKNDSFLSQHNQSNWSALNFFASCSLDGDDADDDVIIEKTPEVPEKWRASRFCRLKKTSTTTSLAKASKSDLRKVCAESATKLRNTMVSSASVAALPTIVTSTPTSPLQKRPKFERGVAPDDKFDDVSPVFDRKFDEKKCSAVDGKISEPSPVEESAKKIVQLEAKSLSSQFGRHRVVKVDRPKFGEILVSLESANNDRKSINCTLKGSWLNTVIKEGDTVNLVMKSFCSVLQCLLSWYTATKSAGQSP